MKRSNCANDSECSTFHIVWSFFICDVGSLPDRMKIRIRKFPTLLQCDLISLASFRCPGVVGKHEMISERKFRLLRKKHNNLRTFLFYDAIMQQKMWWKKEKKKTRKKSRIKWKVARRCSVVFCAWIELFFCLFINKNMSSFLPEEIKNHLKNQSILRWLEEEKWNLCGVDFRLSFDVRFDDDTVVPSASILITMPTH